MDNFSYIGKSVPRKDGPLKATGKAEYTVDVTLPGMLVGKVLRSPYPHARILNIDTSKAERLPGVKAVVTAADSLKIKHGFVETPRYPADQYPIAVDMVRHVGEDIAGVAAVDEDTAEEALSLIEVEYEPLPAVFNPEEAMKPDAPLIHPNNPKVNDPYHNIGGKTATSWGDIEKAFRDSYLVREDKYYCQIRTHGYMEPQATVTHFDHSGKLNVWTSSMGVFIKRAKLARTLGLPYSNVRVLKTYVGGAFGGKIDLFHHEYISSLLSMKCHLPVRIVYSREEVFKASRHAQPLIIQIKTGVTKDGLILGQEIRTINDSGAYHGSGVVVIFLAWGFAMAPYRVPNMKYEGYSIYTNNLVRAPQRGHGAPKMRFAAESQFDMIAEELGMDPIEFRLRNARRPGETLPNGDSVKNFGLTECIVKAADRTDFRNKHEAARKSRKTDSKIKRGIGIGTTAYFGGSLIYPNSSSIIVKLNDDASVSLMTGAVDVGQGCETVLCQIVAEELGVPIEEVQVYAADTETTPIDIGSWISGLTYVTGNAAKKAAQQAMNKLFAIAGEELGVDVQDLVARNKEIFLRESPDRKISYARAIAISIAKKKGDPVIGEGHFRTMKDEPIHPSLANAKGRWTENYSNYAQVAEVEVDTETGAVKILKITTAHDCGFPFNPALVEGQIDGQVSMGQGHILTEEVRVEDGCVINPSFLEYKIPCALDMVETEYLDVITEEYKKDRPYNTKEAGEGYVSGTVAAVANAIYSATGVRANRTPIHPQDILEALEKYRA
ncbi:MAG: xanthine dehydrogenase family protein molybdopterin-binding subunit [Syntrophobacterales bacterium]|jgi:4-hydroxybenzoyl-CoA reductase subunit alpha|nr:xanthine dehydrogenase family protein molybdopterin-binding subunit [Syntrophobacterales bacterium]